MQPDSVPILLDAHVHLYPCFKLPHALDLLHARLTQWAPPPSASARLIALVAERPGDPALDELFDRAGGESRGNPWSLHPGSHPDVWLCRKTTGATLFLVRGRQFASREKMEVLTVGRPAVQPEGQPIAELVKELRREDRIPIIPWSPGKWMFRRNTLLRELIERWAPHLALCDTAIRPRGLPPPPAFRWARERQCPLLAGSDPLPRPGEEEGLGQYGTELIGADPTADPAAIVEAALRSAAVDRRRVGRRDSPMRAVLRWARYQMSRNG